MFKMGIHFENIQEFLFELIEHATIWIKYCRAVLNQNQSNVKKQILSLIRMQHIAICQCGTD